jgi:hypothetical protein
MGGALALGGCRFLNIQQSNGIWCLGWVIYWGGCATGVERMVGHSAIVLAVQLIDKKYN